MEARITERLEGSIRLRTVIIDSSHKKWVLGTGAIGAAGTALYLWLARDTPGGLTGGSTVGLWYGIAGSLLMVFAGLLSALRKVPSWWWIGSRAFWLKGHIWLGLLSGIFILCHSGFHWGGPLERVLWIVFGLVLATGIFGLALQQFLPHTMTTRVPCEAPFEQIPNICLVMRRKADKLIETAAGNPKLEPETRTSLQDFYERQVRPFLSESYCRSSHLANPLQAELVFTKLRSLPGISTLAEVVGQLQTFCEERRQLGEQERIHYWLHGWLLIHVPLSVALLVLGIAHAVMSLYY